MNKLIGLVLGLSFLAGGAGVAAAQESVPMPKVLVLYREYLKPGKAGSAHEKAESAFVQASVKAKWPQHYIAVTSLSGRPRALFLYPFESFEAWEKDSLATQKNAVFAAANDRAALADGELLSDSDSTALAYREDQSLRANGDISHDRYLEISLFQIRPGHRKEWDELVKLVVDAYAKIPDAHWATYEVVYGQQPNSTFVVFSGLKAASEIDHSFAEDKEFAAAMGEDGLKKLDALEAAAIESRQSNLFMFSPKMSYPSEAMIKADPDFWAPKAAPAAASKKSDKPAQ